MQRKKSEQLNLLPVAQDYFNCIFTSIPQMKALLLDHQTSGIISIIYTQSKLYKNQVYLIQKIQQKTQKLLHLKAVYFIRHTRDNLNLLKQQLNDPCFKQYHIFFTNQISQQTINELADADKSDKIKNLQQVYLDYYAIGRNIFSLNIPSTINLIKKRTNWEEIDKKLVTRISDGLISLLMSLRLMPQVRYIAESDACQELARIVSNKLEKEFNQKPSDYLLEQRAILIITERKEDVVTPLLTPWTYQAMLHEFIGVFNNKVDIKNKQKAFISFMGIKEGHQQSIKEKEEQQFVLSELTDDFFRKNAYSGFGELATNIKSFINEVSVKRNRNIKLQSLQDMQSALDKMPELNNLSATLQKHVTLSCQISQQIQKGLLFEVSRVEQDLVCQDNRKDNIQAIWKILRNQRIEYYLKFKLVLLFSIKYPNDKQLKQMIAHLMNLNPDKQKIQLINLIGQYQMGRKSDLFHMRNFKKKAMSYFDRVIGGVTNVYTQHKPYLLENVVPEIVQDKLRENDYRVAFKSNAGNPRNKPIIILFFVGGVTYTEAKDAEAFEDVRIIVGGSFIHNSKTFISEVIQLQNDSTIQ